MGPKKSLLSETATLFCCTAGTSLVFLRLPRSCAGVAHGIQLQYAIATAHPSTGPFSPQPEHGRGEKGPVEGLVEAHGL